MKRFIDRMALHWLAKREPYRDIFSHHHAVRSALCCACAEEQDSPDDAGYFVHEIKVHDRLGIAFVKAGVRIGGGLDT